MSEEVRIDPIQYGRMMHSVEELENRVGEMERDIKELLKLANQSRGGFWVGMTLAAALGGVVSTLAKFFWP